MYRKGLPIHFVGIGGIGMSGIAELLLNLGYRVSGSDLRRSDTTERLEGLGAVVWTGHAASNVPADGHVVVVSSAVRPGNPEVLEAHRRKIPVIPRAEMLAELMRMKYGIAIAGTHGKTTTTSMVATVLATAGWDPTAVVGGKLNSLGSNAKLGMGEFLVAEADESDGSFLKLSPTVAVVTNIDPEHLDFYSGIGQIKETFLHFINKVPFYGFAVLCIDHPNVQELIPSVEKTFVTYGFSRHADYRADEIVASGMTNRFAVFSKGNRLGEVLLRAPGRHNVSNALAAAAVASELGIPFEQVRAGLFDYAGVGRRFQVKGEAGGVTVVDDYGHHPVEVRATLAAAREVWPDRRIVVGFQPHRYTRTRALFREFLSAFHDADVLLVFDVYSAGEDPIEGATGEALCLAVREHGHREARYVGKSSEAGEAVRAFLRPGDIFLTMGAGDVWKLGEGLLPR
ncbi:MAG TPA: UDP-N-acetylmuramate--L-alanine ligase [Deltaproteobacteria bacterium]|nr:MAG: UDP-N-acetylmuramate--L-alanine ligase [Deltaproteobacteria bacterium GWA2_65_63]OGP27648.1 MAG: UDP-N-acetylmuramate--L-alanine ligase [Deltaproteobacteria bacterium GWB2_65_81]OGP39875.1 MAG: UDP-N-acetylmuramate--L-alanine ligase [Deltaproteobacteria bacterium GWC2_66_88]OGP78688.1 MAG: UDP-N-acetylmuramate--L-alanine ligase [Deltaproteobacteria bacterium RBG_16_66_15]HAM32122.1 UDP-N-acetylmuramate--L-alanine ligase [Deltaproteobacteria bacterium]